MNWHQIQGPCRHVLGEAKRWWRRAQHPGTLQAQPGLFAEAAEILWLRNEAAQPEDRGLDSGGSHASAERPPTPVSADALEAAPSHVGLCPSVEEAPVTKPEAFLHLPSGAVRFWIPVGQGFLGASIHSTDLHYRYCSHETTDQPLATFLAHASEIEAAVRRRLDAGALEPVILRGPDLQPLPSP